MYITKIFTNLKYEVIILVDGKNDLLLEHIRLNIFIPNVQKTQNAWRAWAIEKQTYEEILLKMCHDIRYMKRNK